MVAINCHWVDKRFQLQEALLGFKRVQGSHTGQNLASIVFETLEDFNVTKKLFCITTDNASNNTTMMSELSSLLKEQHNLDWDPKEHHIACLNHVINLAVQSFLKDIKVIDSNFEDGGEDPDETDESLIVSGDESFSTTTHKIRSIAKVISLCSVQIVFLPPNPIICTLHFDFD